MNELIAKKRFLLAYNPTESDEVAASRAIRAAVQRNSPYLQQQLSWKERKRLNSEWRKLLTTFPSVDTVDGFCAAIVELKSQLSDIFGREGCIRISHAQKSASVYLKHRWCMGRVSTPPVCPIDRKILEKALGTYKVPLWTRVDCVSEYRKQFELVRSAALQAGQSVADWELQQFPTK